MSMGEETGVRIDFAVQPGNNQLPKMKPSISLVLT
jgi:hypothetical protein